MNLKTYTQQNAPHKVEPKANKRLSLSVKSTGLFILGRILYEKMGKPSGIVILQDTQYPTDFYLRASKDPMAFQLKPGSRNQVRMMSNTMAGIMADALKLTPPYTVHFKVTEKEDGLYCIAVLQPKLKKKQ